MDELAAKVPTRRLGTRIPRISLEVTLDGDQVAANIPVETKGEAYLRMCGGLFQEADVYGTGELGVEEAPWTP